MDKKLFYFCLPSQGPHPAIHFIWKADTNDVNIERENTKLVVTLRAKKKTCYNQASKRIIKKMLHRIGVVKSHKAEFIIKPLLGDASAPVTENQAAILDRFNRYVQLGDDIICDLRQNNRVIPKFNEFWNIVATYIDDKTVVGDWHHRSSTGETNVIVNIALVTSLADTFRQWKQIDRESPVSVPTYSWFLYQFWHTTKTQTNMTHYTGCFEVKRIVQARLLRKENVDSHYTNATQGN